MSLETQVTALVTAANNLTESVNGKINEIDQKVGVAVAAVPSEIARQMSRGLFVDPVSGNDANTGLSWAAAKATIRGAVNSCPSGGVINVWLKNGVTHYISGGDVVCTNKVITILAESYNYNDRTTYADIRADVGFMADGTLVGYGFLLGMSGFACFLGCKITTSRLTAAHVGKANNIWMTAFFKTNSGMGNIFMQHCQIDIWHGAMTYQHSAGSIGKTDLLMRNVLLNKQDLSAQPVTAGHQYMMGSYGNAPIPFSMYGIEMVRTNYPTWASAISQDLTNAITNLKD